MPMRSTGRKPSAQVTRATSPRVEATTAWVSSSRPAWSTTAATWVSRWVSTPTVTGLAGAGMLSMTVPSGLLGQGRHAPIGTVDSTAMGPLARLLSGHSARPVGALSALRQLADRSNARHQAGETSGQTSHGGHHPDHPSEEFLYELKAGLRAAAAGRLNV